MRKPFEDPEAQARNVQLVRITGRAAARPLCDTPMGIFERVDEGERDRLSRFDQVVLDRVIDVAPRPLAEDDRLGVHRGSASRIRPRSRSK